MRNAGPHDGRLGINVVSGRCRFSLDVRAPTDAARDELAQAVLGEAIPAVGTPLYTDVRLYVARAGRSAGRMRQVVATTGTHVDARRRSRTDETTDAAMKTMPISPVMTSGTCTTVPAIMMAASAPMA